MKEYLSFGTEPWLKESSKKKNQYLPLLLWTSGGDNGKKITFTKQWWFFSLSAMLKLFTQLYTFLLVIYN